MTIKETSCEKKKHSEYKQSSLYRSTYHLLITYSSAYLTMCLFDKIIFPFIMAFVAWASLSCAEEKHVKYGDLDVTLVKENVTRTARLTERSWVPPECSFDSPRGDFQYLQIKGIQGTACIGWDNLYCGDTWNDPDWTDIQDAMRKIVAMDGQSSASSAGAWHGTFFLFTTAFADRNTAIFDFFLSEMSGSSYNIYWSRNGDFANVWRDPDCPGDLW